MKNLTIILILINSNLCFAQNEKPNRLSRFDMVLQGNIESNEGTVILNDGKELTGLLAYNDKTGILKFERGNDSRSLTARNVMAFEVYDPNFDDNRMFYSLQKEDPETGAIRPFFFELIKDFKSFAVLVRKEPVNIKDKTDWNPLSNNNLNSNPNANNPNSYSGLGSRGKTVIEQVETFYLLSPQGSPEPYFSRIVSNNAEKNLFVKDQKVKEKFVSKDLLKEYVGSNFEKLQAYADENRLSFKEKSDFLKILEYYETLLD
jgi:hypothetical protein